MDGLVSATRTHTHAGPTYGGVGEGKQILTHGQTHWEITLGKNIAVVHVHFFFSKCCFFCGGQGRRGGRGAKFASAFAGVKLEQKLGANLSVLPAEIDCQCVREAEKEQIRC